jgi:integrase/recombinase XerD
MNAQLADSGAAINRFLLHVHPRSRGTVAGYRCILAEFQRHVQLRPRDTAICQSTLESWLHNCASRWPDHYVLHRARVVDRFLDFLAPKDPFRAIHLRCFVSTTASELELRSCGHFFRQTPHRPLRR